MHEVLAELFAVGDDVDAGIFLGFDPGQGGVPFALGQLLALQLPFRPQGFGLGKPDRLRQAAGNGGLDYGATAID